MMRKSWLGILLVTVVATAALIGGGALEVERPNAAVETPSTAELFPELQKGSTDSGPQSLAMTVRGGAVVHFSRILWHVRAPHLRIPTLQRCPALIQPRSPPLRVDRFA
ncbi:MAG: hypothetical protein PVG78_16095 [Desulfobacterales bacterium]|jgi:hypothetical protein